MATIDTTTYGRNITQTTARTGATDGAGRTSGTQVVGLTPTASALVIKSAPGDPAATRAALRESLSGLFDVLHRRGSRDSAAALDKALNALGSLADKAAASGKAIEIRLGSLYERAESEGGRLDLLAGFVIEAKIAGGDGSPTLLDLNGETAVHDADSVADGLVSGRYRRTVEAPQLSADAKKAQEAAETALKRLRETQDALSAFRSGDGTGLRGLIDRLQSSTYA